MAELLDVRPADLNERPSKAVVDLKCSGSEMHLGDAVFPRHPHRLEHRPVKHHRPHGGPERHEAALSAEVVFRLAGPDHRGAPVAVRRVDARGADHAVVAGDQRLRQELPHHVGGDALASLAPLTSLASLTSEQAKIVMWIPPPYNFRLCQGCATSIVSSTTRTVRASTFYRNGGGRVGQRVDGRMNSGRDPELSLRLIGPLRLVRRDGVDVTPRGTKAQGLLALLGVSPGLRRSRAWLKDKLWSDRQDEQASASLRQVLSMLRHEVAAEAPWLLTQGHWVVLDPARIAVVLQPGPGDWETSGEPSEFCEGLDIADPEFEDWIRDQRLAWADRLDDEIRAMPPAAPVQRAVVAPPAIAVPVLIVSRPQAGDDSLHSLSSLVATEVAGRVARIGGATIVFEEFGVPPPSEDAVRLQTKAIRIGDRAMVQAEFCDPARGTLLWASSRTISLLPGRSVSVSEVETLVAAITAAATLQIGRQAPGPASALARSGYRALRDVLAFDPETLANSDRAFATAAEARRAPILQAWRAHLRVISIIERLTTDRGEAGEEAMDLAFHALEDDPLNPIINAIAADVALHVEDRPLKAATLAQLGVDLDPASPFTHASLAQALARLGKAPAAHVESLRALRLSLGQPNQAWWYMRCCVTAVRCDRLEAAVRFAETAHELSPRFKAPLRFLAALRFHLHDEAGAAKALVALKALEPDFSLDLMASDSYPLATLRSAGLLKVSGSGLI